MPTHQTNAKSFEDIISDIPKTAKKVKVFTLTGEETWKRIDDLLSSDKINIGGSIIYTEFDSSAQQPSKKSSKKKQAVSVGVAAPSIDDNDYLDEAIRKKLAKRKAHIAKDGLYQIIKKNPDAIETLQQIMLSFSEEQASIEFEKICLEEQGINASRMSMNRVRVLEMLGETWLKHKELLLQEKTGMVDLNSDAFGRLFKFIAETFTDAMQECGIDPQFIRLTTVHVSKSIDDSWKTKAVRKMMGEDK